VGNKDGVKMRSKTMLLALALTVLFALPGTGEERERIELKPVLIVIDVQNIWMPHMDGEDISSAPRKINESIALFREFGHPVIRVYHSDPKRGPEPDTDPFEFPDSIAVTDDDPIVVKNHPSSFTKTDLERIIRESGRNTVFLCGLSATGCVLATYFGAQDREFMVVMVEGALLSHDASYTKVIEDICSSTSIEEVRATLEDPYL
jgi:nicotinamidase-related amidase